MDQQRYQQVKEIVALLLTADYNERTTRLADLCGSDQELRRAGRDVLAIQVFLVPPSAPYPLPEPPAPADPSSVAYFEVRVDEVLLADRPNAIVAMAGPVVSTPGSPFGDLTGVLSYLNFQYVPGPPLRFRAVFGGSAGVITTNAASGAGTLEWKFQMP